MIAATQQGRSSGEVVARRGWIVLAQLSTSAQQHQRSLGHPPPAPGLQRGWSCCALGNREAETRKREEGSGFAGEGLHRAPLDGRCELGAAYGGGACTHSKPPPARDVCWAAGCSPVGLLRSRTIAAAGRRPNSTRRRQQQQQKRQQRTGALHCGCYRLPACAGCQGMAKGRPSRG